jgi:hypothetical protein
VAPRQFSDSQDEAGEIEVVLVYAPGESR